MVSKKISIISLISFFLLFGGSAFADIVEDHQNPNLSVLEYVDISVSDNEEGTLTKKIKLKVENIGDSTLFNLKMDIRLVPDSLAIVKGDLSFGDLNPGDIVLSVDTVEYIINTNKLENGEIPIIWAVEFRDMDEKVWKNESIIIETINK